MRKVRKKKRKTSGRNKQRNEGRKDINEGGRKEGI